MIKSAATELGFSLCGIARARRLDRHGDRLADWIGKGYHGEMDYMTRNQDKRVNPELLVEGARSVIVVALNYYQVNPTRGRLPEFSTYALGKDYHREVKDKLYTLFEKVKALSPGTGGRVFVDSAPVLERAWANEAGLGWSGKNSLLINRQAGSCVFLGTIITSIELEYDSPFDNDYCGNCTRCIDACPTGAIIDGRIVDSRKCISYLSIEKRGEFANTDESLNGKVFGCDICQEVCPWNRKVTITKEEAFSPLDEIEKFSLADWNELLQEQFEQIFSGSPVMRAGFEGFRRNLKHL